MNHLFEIICEHLQRKISNFTTVNNLYEREITICIAGSLKTVISCFLGITFYMDLRRSSNKWFIYVSLHNQIFDEKKTKMAP